MDLLFSRYASPFLLLDEILACGRFTEFTTEFLKMNNKRVREETYFDIWLHKVWDQGYSEFMDSNTREVVPQDVDFETTINESMNILKGFNPEESE
jgi:hypothetical protein